MGCTRSTLLIGLTLLAWAHAAHAGRVAMQKVPYVGSLASPTVADGKATVGWSFKPQRDIRITHLGFFDLGGDGLLTDHVVTIWDAETQDVVAQATIQEGPSSILQWLYRYEAIEPVLLEGRHRYIIGATVPTSPEGDLYPVEDVSSVKPLAQIVQRRVHPLSLNLTGLNEAGSDVAPGDPVLPALPWAGMTTLAPNFKYLTPPLTAGEAIPEPASLGVLAAAGSLLALRRRRRHG